LYEGFGFPVLDAFYHGIPVVTSNVSGMKEVAGDAAVLIDPENIDHIQHGLEKALKQPKVYVTKGKERLKQFASWDRVATETIKIYGVAYEKVAA
jgi:glycosyltransferase involved in cell wall biosynthesis